MTEIRISRITQSVIDSLLEHIAIMDRSANIIATNRAWNDFAIENGATDTTTYSVGANYIDTCRPVAHEDCNTQKIVSNLKQLLAGEIESFSLEYPCHSPKEKRWFLLYATPFIVENEHMGAVVSHINITKRKMAELEAIRYAKYDDLTGTLNRRFGLEKLVRQIELSDRYNQIFTICFIDIDNLKYVNDTFGHAAGDILLKQTARIIKSAIRKTDMVVRMGGDEFMLIFPHTRLSGVREFVKRIMQDIKSYNTGIDNITKFEISFSYGFAEYNPMAKVSSDRLVEIADNEMYEQKMRKKSRV